MAYRCVAARWCWPAPAPRGCMGSSEHRARSSAVRRSVGRLWMHLVEQHVIRKTDLRYAKIDAAAFASKNLYNAANFLVRQAFIHEGVYLNYAAIFHCLKDHEAYCALPRKVRNDVLRQLDKNWRSFFAARDAWREDPSQFV